MPEWNNLIEKCVHKPSYELMAMAYSDYKVDSAPCKRGAKNQCAIRMSVALGRCGFDLLGFPKRKRVHTLFDKCKVPVEHVLGARELAKYLQQCWGTPEIYKGKKGHAAAETLKGRTGIIYFDNCFQREPGEAKSGDHIDLWDGGKYYNIVIKVGAGGDATPDTPLFAESEEVWFFPLAA
ncbi:MAG: type VI secretion system amidase effector protein Tae4 [Pyrinomonadaceae bacterium]